MALRAENFLLQRYIEKAMVDMPGLPTVVVQVVRATERETVTTAEIESLIGLDAAITTKLLKVVNSAYFGLQRQVANVSQAIAILGLQQTRNLVLSIGVLTALSSSSPRVVEAQRRFWIQSFASATCAQRLARQKGLSKRDAETAFVAGLLHDVGKLFLLTLFNLPYEEVKKHAAKTGESISSAEQRVLGASHAELGARLAEKWAFPAVLVSAIGGHDLTGDEAEPTLFCVHIADRVADRIDDPESPTAAAPIDQRAMAWAGLTDADLQTLMDEVTEDVERAKELVGVL